MHLRKPLAMTFILIAVLGISNCAMFSKYGQLERSATLAYQRADYDTALFMLVNSLQLKPDYEKSQVLITDAFLMANRKHLDRISSYKKSTDHFRYDDLVREYQSLINLHDAVKNLPPIRHKKTGALVSFEIIDYTSDLDEMKMLAAESHYAAGARLAEADSKDDQKEAAKEFKRALSFIPDYKDAELRYANSRKAGVKRIAVFPFDDLSGKRKRYGSVEELVVDEMVASVMKDESATEFLELISRDQLDRVLEEQKLELSGMVSEATAVEVGSILGVHEIITGKITQIIYSPVQDIEKEYKETARVVVRTEKYKDKDGKTKSRNIYDDVDAKVHHFTRNTKAVIKGSYRIVDVKSAAVLKSESFEGKAEFNAEWVTFTGDERALNSRTAKLARQGETLAPVADEMVSRAASDLANSLSASLKVYAR